MIQASAVWHTEPEILAAWGSFGAIFTAIAVAHTLYAPREVILWNWRRIVLLGISLAIAVGSQFSMIIVVPIALAFLLYLAPIRRPAALIIWTAACLLALLVAFRHLFLPSPCHFPKACSTLLSGEPPGAASPSAASTSDVAREILRACPAAGRASPGSRHDLSSLAAAPATSATLLPA